VGKEGKDGRGGNPLLAKEDDEGGAGKREGAAGEPAHELDREEGGS
jgi:hypothetical protein